MQHFTQAFFVAIPPLQRMAAQVVRNPCKIFLGQIKRSLPREVVVGVITERGAPYPDRSLYMVTYVVYFEFDFVVCLC